MNFSLQLALPTRVRSVPEIGTLIARANLCSKRPGSGDIHVMDTTGWSVSAVLLASSHLLKDNSE